MNVGLNIYVWSLEYKKMVYNRECCVYYCDQAVVLALTFTCKYQFLVIPVHITLQPYLLSRLLEIFSYETLINKY